MAEAAPSGSRRLRDIGGTVRVRTTVAAVLVVGIALLGASIALVRILDDSLTHSVEEQAVLRSDEVAAALAPANAGLGVIGTREDDEVVQVVDREGRVIGWSENAAGRPPLVALAPGGSAHLRVAWDADVEYLFVAAAAELPAGPSTVLVGRALDDVADATRIVSNLLALGLPLLLVVVASTTWIVTGRALSPVESIRREVDAISASELHRRVPQPSGGDEIGRLARTMNGMLARLEASQARQRRFVSDASHELRSPVATIRQHAEVALAHPDRVSVGDLAETVLAEDLRVEALVEDLLLLARADEGTLPIVDEPLDLDDVALEEARRVAGSSRLAVDQARISGGRVRGDATQLRRLTRNLVDNAARHARSRVVISVHEEDGFVVLRVDDDGAGVPRGDRGRVFERFVRLDDGRGRDEGGAGLGLAIVAEIAAAHGGTVALDEAPGGGARFEVRLPRLAY